MDAKGTVHKYGNNIDTDVIIPARYLNTQDIKELATHCMEYAEKDFAKKVKKGDIMVAGENFGLRFFTRARTGSNQGMRN